jgi:hypothetical protein
MTYATIQPPFTLKFREMPKKELTDYFAWFRNIQPQRLDELANAVKQTPGFEAWKADFTPASLDRMGEWFAEQIKTRLRTEEEILQIRDQSSIPIEIPGEELTNRTFSLAMDIGMYFSQVLLKNHPTLQWEQQFGNKKDADYGQPVLVGFGPVAFNPVRLMVTLAYGVVSKKKTGKSLRELYDIWAKNDLRVIGEAVVVP